MLNIKAIMIPPKTGGIIEGRPKNPSSPKRGLFLSNKIHKNFVKIFSIY
jgi:hypothetical protein